MAGTFFMSNMMSVNYKKSSRFRDCLIYLMLFRLIKDQADYLRPSPCRS